MVMAPGSIGNKPNSIAGVSDHHISMPATCALLHKHIKQIVSWLTSQDWL